MKLPLLALFVLSAVISTEANYYYELHSALCGAHLYYCARSHHCIPWYQVCNYDNNCIDNRDESRCSEHCATRQTRFTYDGRGNMVYLDRQSVSCGTHEVFKGFKLIRNAAAGNRIAYRYRCCKLNKPICTRRTKVNRFTYDGRGNTVYLDRQVVDCGRYSYLTSFHLVRNRAGNHVRYIYGCCGLRRRRHRRRTHCYFGYTPFNAEGGGRNIYLDRHRLSCRGRFFLNYFHLQRNGHGRYRYQYRCCRVVS